MREVSTALWILAALAAVALAVALAFALGRAAGTAPEGGVVDGANEHKTRYDVDNEQSFNPWSFGVVVGFVALVAGLSVLLSQT